MAKTQPTSLIPQTAFTMLTWWGKLKADEQKIVEKESQELARAIFNEGASKLEQGKHLVALRDYLEPYRVFVKHLKNFRMSTKTAYRYMAGYQNAKKKLPEAVLAQVLARGIDIIGVSTSAPLGKYTGPIQRNPPPKSTSDPEVISKWIDTIEKDRKEHKTKAKANGRVVDAELITQDPDTLMKEAFSAFKNRFQKLPNNSKSRGNWTRAFVGMCMTHAGMASSQSFEPVAIPEEFRRGPGRPVEA